MENTNYSQQIKQIVSDALLHTENLRRRDAGQSELPLPESTAPKRRSKASTAALITPKTKKTPLSWFKTLVSDLDIGELVWCDIEQKHKPVHLIRNKSVIEHFQNLSTGAASWLHARWSKKRINQHCQAQSTCYYSGSHKKSYKYFLLMIDVDCHKSGNLQGANAYLEFLRENYFPSLYFETSTNGNGGHGYLIVDKEGFNVDQIKETALRQLEPWLNSLTEGFDIEYVEVKGLPPNPKWGNDKYELKTYQSGTLAKVPRGLIDRFDELKNTTVVKLSDFMKLPFIKKKSNIKTNSDNGSISGKIFNEKELSGLLEGRKYDLVSQKILQMLDKPQIDTAVDAVVTKYDLSVFLMFGEYFSNNMNQDGTLPTERYCGMWNSAKSEGDIDRGWNHHRYKAMRDALSALDLIDWTDENYIVGVPVIDREGKKKRVGGKACKWSFSEDLLEMLTAAEMSIYQKDQMDVYKVMVSETEVREHEEKPLMVDVSDISSLTTERREHPLWKVNSTFSLLDRKPKPFSETTKPVLVEILSILPVPDYSPDDLADFIKPITQIAA